MEATPTWTCETCNFSKNAIDLKQCIACGSDRSLKEKSRKSSARSRQSRTSSVAREEVFVLQPAKPLGVKLRPPKKGVITKGISVDHCQNPDLEGKIYPGDTIVAIGGKPLVQVGFSEAIQWIRELPRPLEITFEIIEARRKSMAEKKAKADIYNVDSQLPSYAVVFEDGPMGLNLEAAVRYGIEGAVVKAVKGQAEDSGCISIGDIVSKVNENDVLFMPHAEVMQAIRNSSAPRTIQFVPKDKLSDIQRINSRQSEVFGTRDSILMRSAAKPSKSKRSVDSGKEDATSIKDLILQNSSATIKKGGMFKQGRIVKNWKHRFFVLSVSKLEYFKSESSGVVKGELGFIDNRCTVRDLPPQEDIVCKSPSLVAQFLIELRVADRKMILACTSANEKTEWFDALKLAIDASKSVNQGNSASQALSNIRSDRGIVGDALKAGNSGGSSGSFPVPIVHVTVLSASNLAKRGSSINASCEITLESESFKTLVVKSHRNPVWRQDNTAAFEARSEDTVMEIRIFDEHTFRSNELISTLTIPIKSLPNMQKAIKKYPLVLSSRVAGAQLTLALEYINKEKAFHQEEQRLRLNDDMARASVLMERDEVLKIRNEAQAAADEATQAAKQADEDAAALLRQAQEKADAALAAAKAEGQAAVEAMMAEAAEAKEEAERRANEAQEAQMEAQALIEANKQVQETANSQEIAQNFISYRRMLVDNVSQEKVREKMVEDGVDEVNITAFFEGLISYDQKVKSLQAQVELLRGKEQKEKKQEDFAAYGVTGGQEKLLRRLFKLEKQIQQAGLQVAEDIPFEEAKAKVKEISTRMQEIGSADVIHPDKDIQKQLREEYYKLEQDMEKYNTALVLTDEYASEQQRMEREWEEENSVENNEALYAVRQCMPVEVKTLSEAQLQELTTPNGKKISAGIAKKFKRTNVLQILRTDPKDILRMHPSLLENLRVTGLTLTERRAIHVHLKDIAETWRLQKQEEMSKRKWSFFSVLLETFKPLLKSYNTHVEQFGPPGNHPYATPDDRDNGCTLLGRQCPLKANAVPDYTVNLGFPQGAVYAKSKVQKSDAEDAGAKALREAKELLRAKAANARADSLKKHYKGNVREAAKASGACDDIDSIIDKIEFAQRKWIAARLAGRSSRESIKSEISKFSELLSSMRLSMIAFAERSGMQLSGKRSADKDQEDTRSGIEIGLLDMLIESLNECMEGILDRLTKVGSKEKRILSAIDILKQLTADMSTRNASTMRSKKLKTVAFTKKRKSLAEITEEVSKELQEKQSSGTESTESRSSTENDATMARSRSSRRGGRGGGRAGLFAAIAQRKSDDSEKPPPAPGLLDAIRGGRGGGGRGGGLGGRGDLMAALAKKRKD